MTSATAVTSLPELTLIVAATSRIMGIGLGNKLPWTGLRREMAYFRRVTSRVPVPSTTSKATDTAASQKRRNAVIMGRKTWEGIPPRFRPLEGRINVVVSRSHQPLCPSSSTPQTSAAEGDGGAAAAGEVQEKDKDVVRAASLADALDRLAQMNAEESSQEGQEGHGGGGVARVFVIGGAQLYAAALGLPHTRRVLLTRIEREFECDVFFPLQLATAGEGSAEGGGEGQGRWVRRSKDELDSWVGEEVPGGVQEENGTRYEFEMWEKVD